MRIEDGASESRDHLVFAYYVVRHLILAGHDVHVVTGAPDFVFTTEIQSPRLFLRKYSETAVVPRASILETEVKWLNSINADLVVSDVVPVACRAAADAGIRSVCVTNFSWDFIYAEYVMAAGYHHRSIVWQIAEDYSHCEFLIRLPGYCPMPAFRDVIDVPLVVRRLHKCRNEVRRELGIGDDVKVVVLNFGGQVELAGSIRLGSLSMMVWSFGRGAQVHDYLGLCVDRFWRRLAGIAGYGRTVCNDWKMFLLLVVLFLGIGMQPGGWKLKEEYLPSGWLCLVCGASENQELPPNFIKLAKDAYTPDVIAASDCMLGKIGYGTVSEALAFKLPFVFVRRDYFNEEPFLRNMLEYYQCGVEMIRRDLLTGHWRPYLERAVSLKPCYEGGINGGEVAARILQNTAIGKNYESDKLSGARRLRDAIVLGYQLQRVPGRDICIPDWYANAENELGLRTGSPAAEMNETSFPAKAYAEDFEILHGDLLGLSDTMSFLNSLSELDAECDSAKHTEKRQIRERMAAANLFNWEEDIIVARAPGRLDVVGGIADYSGCLVLQMPIREACHVAVQTLHPSKQRLWKHAQARQHDKGQESTPVLQIVSYGSELSNRGPTFDMDLSDFLDGGQPISYEKAKIYFARDPSQKWAAYVAGTILVLMKELGVRFENSISMLVSSAVPEGKGVSSSASVEVASMSAMAAALGLNISPRELALLCQKVENHVVGAPCGVMDQMTSACGEANKLLAMVCQPAEVLGLVDIPGHIRFWGIDSGLRHSIGGADYGSVRVGAFMGRKMIKLAASAMLSPTPSSNNGMTTDELDDSSIELVEAEASLDYLCNLSPHRYEALYAKILPESMLGETFLEKYANHNDPVTVIDSKRKYGVKAAARHPIYENFRVKTMDLIICLPEKSDSNDVWKMNRMARAFKALLTSAPSDDQLTALGGLMYQCHYSYSACGLGSDGTDRLVQLVQEMQHSKLSKPGDGTLYGAKITGGGSGGTVCVIGRNCLRSTEQILQIQQRYRAATGYLPFVFEGSSPGAGKFGYLRIRRRHTLKKV
ncbi:hypothetical protein RJ640_016014 [Escallonia rubra]|uniref:L-arabinokinase n=1 Tax=Escallonia rubra TaxID=112253 RepID=A0AA88RJ14_9ASTE|nr:hypothetical protein RJ640_016014 [Escallonia rubra]